MAVSGMSPVAYFKCLRNVVVCLSPISSPISSPFMISSPQNIMPLYPSLLTSGDYMGEDLSDILILFPISSTGDFSSSDLRVVSFRVMRPSSSVSGVSIISLFTPDPLDLCFKIMSILDMSLLISIVRSAWSLDYSLYLTMAVISLDLYSR